MYPPGQDHPGQVRAARTGLFQTMADKARAAEWETIRPEDEGRLFYQKKSWQKMIIMAGGPTMNILLAFVILLGVAGDVRGQPDPARRRRRPALHRRRPTRPTRAAPARPRPRPRRPGCSRATSGGVQRQPGRLLGRGVGADPGQPRPPGHPHRRPGRRGGGLPTVNTVVAGVPDTFDPSKRVAAGFLGVDPVVARERGGPVAWCRTCGR